MALWLGDSNNMADDVVFALVFVGHARAKFC